MQERFLIKIDQLRSSVGKPFNINSGFRCPDHNEDVGGAKGSAHLFGEAADISTVGWTTEEVMKLLTYAETYGFTGIGIATTFIHVDTWHSSPTKWKY
jgi:uncharacterized protein YcbK (DUF882 family)